MNFKTSYFSISIIRGSFILVYLDSDPKPFPLFCIINGTLWKAIYQRFFLLNDEKLHFALPNKHPVYLNKNIKNESEMNFIN